MTTIAFADLISQAEAEGFSNEVLPAGEYDVEIAGVNAGTSQGGKPQIGVRYKVLVGPSAGKSFWDNLTLSTDNPKAVAVFLRKLGQLGLSSDFIKAQTSMETVAASIQTGRQYRAVVGTRDFNQKVYQDLKKITPLEAPIVAAPTVAAAQIVQQAEAAQAAAAPVVLQPAIAAAAAAPVAPAVTAPPTVAF